ncbi:rhythmically expressed gene 2 protein-like [Schistocerca piceifrons]|uniref:rhythmically expressed gene 2 protein-like n=1 Tax=Schistocerca piceifrons TaxID=274613 RepID=UPI001F5E95CD|nr:rhythmically expressed gene 2 protein-like [Schistocerca piceifrons]
MHRFRLVTFDVIGTLLNFRAPPPTFYSEAASRFGIKAQPSDIASVFLSEYEKQSSLHPNFGQQTGIGWKKWWNQLVVEVLDKATNSQYSRTKYDSVAEYLITAYKNGEQYNVADGAQDLLSYLQQTNTILGIISNYDERLHCVLNSLDLNKYFDFVLTSYEAGIEKPSTKIFEKALDLAVKIDSHVSPTCALHIGDKIETDYKGAMKAQWKCALLKKNKDELLIKRLQRDGVLTNYVFNDLSELKARLPHL